MEWFRFYDEVVNDPKVQRLEDDLFKTWVNLLCLASKGSPRGYLPAQTEDIAWALRVPHETLLKRFTLLQQYGFIDFDDEKKCYKMHGWDNRQKASDDVTARVQRHRSKAQEGETLQKRSSNGLEQNRTEKNRRERTDARAGARANSLSQEKPFSPSPKNGVNNGRNSKPALSEVIAEIYGSGRTVENSEEPDNRFLPPGRAEPTDRRRA